jgi:diguanylate cyclase (GGDEF)-like protein
MSFSESMRKFQAEWLPYIGHGSALIGALLIGFIWLSVNVFLENERNSAERAAVKNSMNLAGAFDEHLSRSLSEIDRTLKLLRSRYVRAPGEFDLTDWLNSVQLENEILQVSIIDQNGTLRVSSVDSRFVGMDLSDREHFKVHVHADTDDLFISKPVVGRTTKKWSIQLTRRIANSDGSFGGVIVASLDPSYLTRIYNAVNSGSAGHIRVIGTDGVVRATSGSTLTLLGKDFTGAELFKRYPRETTGWYYSESIFSDRIPRMIAFRALKSHPLIITVGQSSHEIFALLGIKKRVGYLVASVLTLVILAVAGFSINGSMAREQDKKRLERANMLLNATLAHMPHGICMFGSDKKLALANDLYSTMYGLKPEQVPPGTPLLDILKARIAAGSSPKDADKYIEERLADAHSPRPSYVINELQDGRILAISRQAMPDGGSVAIHQDITTQKRAEEKIAYLAHYDALTNLANRARFLEHVSAAAEKYRRDGKRFAVHLLDLDRFKEVNDSLGHAIGDALLFEIASRLSDSVGPDDVVARLGGDEFTVLQAIDSTGSDEAILLANKIRQIISRPFDIDGHHLTIETSIGIALAPEHGLVAHELLKKADLALYRTKADGRNGWRLFESDMEQEANERLTMAMALRESIEREEFELRYQPVVSVIKENVVGVEALLRWRNPKGELIAPGSFIPLAEDTGLIIPLGEWALRRACRDAAGWPSHVRLAVNLSPVQIRGGDMVETVKRALKDSGLAANRLELEVTESVLLQHNEQNLTVLHELQNLGIAIVLDDFGTGYSSLSYLLSFPFDKIKIDRTFVAELSLRSESAAIVSAVSGLARSLNIATTAEGVETAEQFTLLRAAGCTLAQGYLFGLPCTNAELEFGHPQVLRRKAAS